MGNVLQDLEYVTARRMKLPKAVEDVSGEVKEVSRFIHSHAELGSEERQACALLVSKLRAHGIDVTENYLGMDTAFLARLGDGEPKVAIFAEYDALPNGHACGHNLMAAWAEGVAAAFAKSAPLRGTVYVAGSPAEEGRGKYAGSKAVIGPRLREMGVQAVLAVHPSKEWAVGGGYLAVNRRGFTFRGRDAHAASSPEQGLNALDAAVHFYIEARMLRTMVRREKDVIISAIIKDGGTAPNTLPGKSEVWLDIRANDSQYVGELVEKTRNIAENAAGMTGCTVERTVLMNPLDSMKRNPELEELYYKHASKYLPKVASPNESWSRLPHASSDIGNVSQIIPTAQLTFKIGREDLPGHSDEFRERAGTAEAEEAVLTAIAIAYESIREYLSLGEGKKK